MLYVLINKRELVWSPVVNNKENNISFINADDFEEIVRPLIDLKILICAILLMIVERLYVN